MINIPTRQGRLSSLFRIQRKLIDWYLKEASLGEMEEVVRLLRQQRKRRQAPSEDRACGPS